MALELRRRGDECVRHIHDHRGANPDGFYLITGITGEANGVPIRGLQPAGTSIPLNAGYPVDNLVRAAAPQLTIHGFAFALTNGTYANPFYGSDSRRRDFTRFSPTRWPAARASRPSRSPPPLSLRSTAFA